MTAQEIMRERLWFENGCEDGFKGRPYDPPSLGVWQSVKGPDEPMARCRWSYMKGYHRGRAMRNDPRHR